MIPPSERAAAVYSLADLLRAGLPPRAAIAGWPEAAPDAARGPLRRVARRLSLGETPRSAARGLRPWFGDDAARLEAVIEIQERTGGDLVRMLDGLARSIEERAAAHEQARAACAGAALSGRVVAALPLVLVPLLPASRAPLLDATGIAMLVGGAALALVGMRWMSRLTPRPLDEHPVAGFADQLAAILRGGIDLGTALGATAIAGGPLETELRRASRRVALGAPWPAALAAGRDADLARLALSLARADDFGLPTAAALEELARSLRAEQARSMESTIKRAPVLMVVPLVVCVLPSFIVLGLGPFLRGLSLSP